MLGKVAKIDQAKRSRADRRIDNWRRLCDNLGQLLQLANVMAPRTFRGTAYNSITATKNSQSILGTPKPDWLEALGGNNTIITGDGNDVVLAGVDYLRNGNYDPFGGEAIFWNPRADAGNNVISTGKGNDYVATGKGDDFVDLGDGDDIYDGAGSSLNYSGNDTIFGGAGKDIIYAWGGGNKTIDGGLGDDVISVISNDPGVYRDQISGGEGNDKITVSASNNIILVDAGTGNDFMDVSGDNGTFAGGAGNDDIYAFGGKVLGGTGNDLIFMDTFDASAKPGVVDGGAGDDVICTSFFDFPSTGKSIVYGGAGNDKIFSGTGDDIIYDGDGDDVINLRGGFVNLRGGSLTTSDYFGADKVEIKGGGIDTVYLGEGKDTVMLGKAGKATIYGFMAADQLDFGGLVVTQSRNAQGDTIFTTNDASLGQIQLATLVKYTGTVSII